MPRVAFNVAPLGVRRFVSTNIFIGIVVVVVIVAIFILMLIIMLTPNHELRPIAGHWNSYASYLTLWLLEQMRQDLEWIGFVCASAGARRLLEPQTDFFI